MPRNPDDAPLTLDPSTVHRLRGVLDAAGYAKPRIIDKLGTPDTISSRMRRPDIPRFLRLTSSETPLDTLLRLFLIDVPVSVAAVRRAVQPMTLEEWIEAGLIEVTDDMALAAVKLSPADEMLLAIDPPGRRGRMRRNQVMAVAPSTLLLAQLTIRRQVERTLDLGTGCGVQAFLAVPHSRQVIAIDRNSRAVNLAKFNILLNGLTNVEVREGDLFGPVRGEAFDWIVANPPFVISPEARYLYRDSGMTGDQLSQKVIRESTAHLRPDGYAQVLCNWAHVRGQTWQDRLRSWTADLGCDVWVLVFETHHPANYVSNWIPEAESTEVPELTRQFEEWMAYYERQGIEAISYGLVTLHRSAKAANWFRYDESPQLQGPCGDSVLRGFALSDFLQTVPDDAALLATRLKVAPELRWEQQLEPAGQGWSVTAARFKVDGGLSFMGNVDANVVALVGKCRGERTLGDVLAEVAATLGQDPAELTPACLAVVRKLIEQGFLLPA